MNKETELMNENEFSQNISSENVDNQDIFNVYDENFEATKPNINENLQINETKLNTNALTKEEKRIKNKKIFKALLILALPVAMQNLLSALLNIIDNVMVQSLGPGIADPAVSAVLLVNQYIFLFQVIIFAIANSAVVLIAQCYGKGDKKNIPPIFSIALIAAFGLGTIFMIVSAIFPAEIIKLFFNPGENILKYAEDFLSIVAYSFFPFAISSVIAISIRGIKKVNLALIATIISIILNIFFNYCFMFGKCGMPELGIKGAALGTVISRIVEMLILILFTLFNKKYFIWTSIKEQFKIKKDFIKKYFRIFLPACANEVFWVLGNSVYLAFFSKMPNQEVVLSALGVTQSIDKLVFVFIVGVGCATNVLIGNLIGAKEYDETFYQANLIMKFATILGVIVGGMMILSIFVIELFFPNLTPESLKTAKWLLLVFGCVMFVRARNFNYILGIFRSGGDTVFTMILETTTIWLIAVPMAALGVFVFKFPVEITYILIYIEEVFKVFITEKRYKSKKWLKNLVENM